MKKKFKPLFNIIILTGLLVLPFFVFAETITASSDPSSVNIDGNTSFEETSSNQPLNMLTDVAVGSGYVDGNTLPSIAGSIVNIALSLLGIIFVVLIIVSGFKWMTAGGNEEDVSKAKKYISRAIIGLIITLSSWAVWTFIIERLI
jgi:hypothetical protein